MIKTCYLMRHGQTIFNKKKRIQGAVDSPLTELGIAQAKNTKKNYFDKNGIAFDHAYCSTQERASDTLELITDLPYTRLKGLKEMDFGILDGEPEYLNPPVSEYDYYFKNLGGESRPEVRKRMNETITQIMNKPDHDSVLIVSHGAALAAFHYVWKEHSDLVKKSRFYNCCVLKFEYDTDTGIFKWTDLFNEDYTGE